MRRIKIFAIVLFGAFVSTWLFFSSVKTNVPNNNFSKQNEVLMYGLIEWMTTSFEINDYKIEQFGILAKVKSVDIKKNIVKICIPKYFHGFDWCINTQIYFGKKADSNETSLFRINKDISARLPGETIVVNVGELSKYLSNGNDVIVKFQYFSEADADGGFQKMSLWEEEYFRKFVQSGSLTRNLYSYLKNGKVVSLIAFITEGLLGKKLYAMEIDIN